MTKRGVFDEMSTTQQHAVLTGTRIVQSNSCDIYPYREESASSFHLEKWLRVCLGLLLKIAVAVSKSAV